MHLLVHLRIKVDPRVALAAIETAGQRYRQLADEPVIRDAKISQLQGKANQMSDAIA